MTSLIVFIAGMWAGVIALCAIALISRSTSEQRRGLVHPIPTPLPRPRNIDGIWRSSWPAEDESSHGSRVTSHGVAR